MSLLIVWYTVDTIRYLGQSLTVLFMVFLQEPSGRLLCGTSVKAFLQVSVCVNDFPLLSWYDLYEGFHWLVTMINWTCDSDPNDIVVTCRHVHCSWPTAGKNCVQTNAPFYSNLVQFLSSGPVVAMELMGDEAVSVWRRLLGPADSAVARREAPQSVRAQFGTDGIKNVGHGSDSLAAAARVMTLSLYSPLCRCCNPCSTECHILWPSEFFLCFFVFLGAWIFLPIHNWPWSLKYSSVYRLHMLHHQTTCHIRR